MKSLLLVLLVVMAVSAAPRGELPPDRLPSWPADFKWSSAGAPKDYTCTRILEMAEPPQHTWGDNFFCFKAGLADPGMRWSMAGPIAGQKCTQISEGADPHTWNDNFLCLPHNTPYKLQWSSAGPVGGKECIQWLEGADPHTWNDNYLCADRLQGPPMRAARPAWPGDFKWSSAGVPAGYSCARILELAEPAQHTWHDNFFCWKNDKADPGMRWSMAGPLPGHKCVNTGEGADPHTWQDNFICVPDNSPYDLKWSSAGPIGGLACIQWLEGADPHTWNDNYLCHRAMNPRAPEPRGPGGPR